MGGGRKSAVSASTTCLVAGVRPGRRGGVLNMLGVAAAGTVSISTRIVRMNRLAGVLNRPNFVGDCAAIALRKSAGVWGAVTLGVSGSASSGSGANLAVFSGVLGAVPSAGAVDLGTLSVCMVGTWRYTEPFLLSM